MRRCDSSFDHARLVPDPTPMHSCSCWNAKRPLRSERATSSLQPEQAAMILSEADGATWMAVAQEMLRTAVENVRTLPLPDPEDGVRWTPGLALAVTEVKLGYVVSTEKVRLRSLSESIVAAWKRDRTTKQGRLDRNRREGGWGSVSAAVATQTNSQWTARSLTSLEGVLQRANEV